MKILITFFVFFWTNCVTVLDELQQKLDNFERDLKQDSSTQNQNLCHQKFLQTFGIAGYQFAQERPSKLCPYLKQNCCTPQDERITELAWKETGEIALGKRYSVYIKSLEYLLGFEGEAQSLMEDLLQGRNVDCRQSAIKYKQLRINQALMQSVLEVIKVATSKVIEIRKGTFCSICDANTSQALQSFWNTSNSLYKERFFYSRHFCKSLVAETIQSAYFTTRYVKQFLESFSDMISCKANNSTNIEYELPQEEVRETRNCMFFGDKNFFFFCEKYCENFNLTKFVPIFDGHIEQLKNFTRHFARYRQEIFYHPNENQYVKNVQSTEEFLLSEGVKAEIQEVFIKSKIYNFQVDQLKTDFVYNGGVDLTQSCKNADYPIKFSSLLLMTTFVNMFLLIIFQLLQSQKFKLFSVVIEQK